jgi:hypothetical protein
MNTFTTAEQLAADLAGGSVDPNEAQKALAYLRSKRDPKAFFAYLNAIVNNGRVVIRSNQTLDHYREIRDACQRHLRGMDYDEMVHTLGWALRLLRYYRNVPEQVRKAVEAEVPPVALPKPVPVDHPEPAAPQKDPQPAALKSPKQVGDIFTGKVIDGDDEIFLIEVPGHPNVKAILKREPGVPNYRLQKDSARVEVVKIEQKGRKTILHVQRSKREIK